MKILNNKSHPENINKNINNRGQDGIVIVLALIMLLVMSVMAITVSFISNTDFQTMSNYKRGQESFLAAERCVIQTRRLIEEVGIAQLLFEQSVATLAGLDIDLRAGITPDDGNPDLPIGTGGIGAVCRSGFRLMDEGDPDPVFNLPGDVKSIQRLIRNTSLPDSGSGGAMAIPITFVVMGKDARNRDKDDDDPTLNTGTQLAVGIETFTGGGASNVY